MGNGEWFKYNTERMKWTKRVVIALAVLGIIGYFANKFVLDSINSMVKD